MKLLRSIQPTARFNYSLGIIAGLFALSFAWEIVFPIAQIALALLLAFTIGEGVMLYVTGIRFQASRVVPRILSLGAKQEVQLSIANLSSQILHAEIIDELPEQLQMRDFSMKANLSGGSIVRLSYSIRPLKRGVYRFGNVVLFVQTRIGLLKRRFEIEMSKELAVMPSVAEMKQFELRTFADLNSTRGIRKIRRIGHSYEFEQIKEYVSGDEYRSVNWKATSRRGKLMVNQYEDEKSQQIFSVIDQSRSMELPFDGLSLLDYSINTSLVISNIALRKQDKAGLIHFSSHAVTVVPAERSRSHMKRMLEALYQLAEKDLEPNYELLYTAVRGRISSRSLLFLYTNFESQHALERALPLLRKINKLHLLVVIFFENTDISDLAQQAGKNLEEIYIQTTARKHVTMKLGLVQLLRQHGIQTIYTRPADLSVNTVNKYLELKARGLI